MLAKRIHLPFVLKHVSLMVSFEGESSPCCCFDTDLSFYFLLYRNQQVNIVVVVFIFIYFYYFFHNFFIFKQHSALITHECPLSLESSDFSSSAVRSLYHEFVVLRDDDDPAEFDFIFLLALAEIVKLLLFGVNCTPTVFTRSY